MKITRLLPWFGANARNAAIPAKLLDGCTWVAIPFAGSMAEVPHFKPSTQIMVNDQHRLLITLARVVANPQWCDKLIARLDGRIFHPDELKKAHSILENFEPVGLTEDSEWHEHEADDFIDVAEAYFVQSWMGRSGVAGTDGESRSSLALRYNAGGGDSNTRYRSAVESLADWHKVLRRCSFTCEDAFAMIGRINTSDASGRGVYCDPPWPDDGESYVHWLTGSEHAQLAMLLESMDGVRVVVRYGDHPMIRRLYSEQKWIWHEINGRTSANKDKAEVFLERRL